MSGRQLPALGPRGEGWFALQTVLFALIAAAGLFGPAWYGIARTVAAIVGALLMGCGGVLGVRGVLDLRENLTVFPRPIEGARLVDTGAYALVRHPIYGGLIVAAAGWGLVSASPLALAGAALLAVFFALKSRREEAWLVEEVPGYAAYRERTRRLIPWLY
jgi:protein-S-isoprenylcysteine O-methyltransferase Ste14